MSGIPINAEDCAVTSLTEYEIGNVLWRENRKGRLRDPGRVAEIFSEAIRPLRRVEIGSIGEVLAVAIKRDLTFYDASYVHIAEKQGLKLVTEDAELLKKCRVAVRVEKMV